MKLLFQLLLLLSAMMANAQTTAHRQSVSETYLSFAPLGLAEPHAAIGIGVGRRWTKRSAAFLEGAYVAANPVYDLDVPLHGFRLIGQYRFHLYDSPGTTKKSVSAFFGKEHSFVALEGRLKRYSFSQTANFYNAANNTSLNNYPYSATATVYGTAVLLGNSFSLDAAEKFMLELSFGIGVKQKLVSFRDVPPGYGLVKAEKNEWNFVPTIEEEVRTVYLPFAIRLQYRIR